MLIKDLGFCKGIYIENQNFWIKSVNRYKFM